MEPSELMKLLTDLGQFLTAGGAHVYAATYQSVVVSIWRDIYIFSGLSVFCSILAIVMFYLSHHYKTHSFGWEPGTLVVGVFSFVGAIACPIVLVQRIFDLQRIDYLTIEALRLLVR